MDDVSVNAVWPVVVYDLDVICVISISAGVAGKEAQAHSGF